MKLWHILQPFKLFFGNFLVYFSAGSHVREEDVWMAIPVALASRTLTVPPATGRAPAAACQHRNDDMTQPDLFGGAPGSEGDGKCLAAGRLYVERNCS